MKKLLLQFAILFLPFFVSAQNASLVLKDFNKKVRQIATSFKLNEHVWVMQTWMDKETFELAAIDDKMQVLWRTTLSGYPLTAGKFKGHLVAISAAKYERVKNEVLGPYTAFLVDEKTGKLLSQKVIFDSKAETQEFPRAFFNEDGSGFTLVVRQSKQAKVMFGYPTKLNTIQDLTVVKLDDNLNTTILKLKFPDEDVFNITCNNKGDLFLVTHNDEKTIKVTRYEAPKYQPQEPILQEIDVHNASDLKDNKRSEITTPMSDRNSVYFALMHNNADKDNELTVSKFNFSTHAIKTVSEVFNKAHIKEIEKEYVSFDPKFDKPDLSANDALSERNMTEWNGTLVVTLSNREYVGSASSATEGSYLVKGYDSDLKPKFQQIIPCSYRYGHGLPFLPIAYRADKNSLYMLANTEAGSYKLTSFYGQLDLATGKWLKLEKLPKDDIEMKTGMSDNVMWFDNGFIVPYVEMSTFGTTVSLQRNSY